MARLITEFRMTIPASDFADGEWAFVVRIPPIEVIDTIEAAMGIRRMQAMFSAALARAEVQSRIKALGKDLSTAMAEDSELQALVLNGADVAKPDEHAMAGAVLPFCGPPEGIEDIKTWEELGVAMPLYARTVLSAAAREVYERVRGAIGATLKKK